MLFVGADVLYQQKYRLPSLNFAESEVLLNIYGLSHIHTKYYHIPFPHHQTPRDHGRDDLGWSSFFQNYSRRLVLVESLLRQGMYYNFPFPHHQTPTDHGRDDLGWSSFFPNYSRSLVLVQTVLRQGMYYHFPFPHHQTPNHHGRDDFGWSSLFPNYSRRFLLVQSVLRKGCITTFSTHTTKHPPTTDVMTSVEVPPSQITFVDFY